MTDENKGTLEGLNKKVDAVIDHTATQLGALTKWNTEADDTFDGIHDKIELLENRFAGVEQNMGARVTAISDDQEEMRGRLIASLVPTRPDRTELFKALVAAQLEIKNADTNVTNEFTNKKYADLASVMNAVREPLAKNGLAIIQLTEDQEHGVLGIRTLLVHESGQVIEDLITMLPEKSTPQGIGSCRTYMRRYAVLAICAIAGAIDDDAGGATKDPNDYPRISVDECEKIIYTADERLGDRADEVVKRMLNGVFGGVAVVGDIHEGQADVALNAIENAAKLIEKKATAAKKKDDKLAKEELAAKKAADAEAEEGK